MTRGKIAIHAVLVAAALAAVSGCDLFVDSETRIERARAHLAEGDYRTAEIELKNVLRSDADSERARALLGEALLALGAVDAAIKEFERARDLGAPAETFLLPYARALARKGDAAAVLELDPEALEDAQRRATLLAIMGRADLSRGNLEPAREQLERALDLDPGQPDALVGLAHLLRQRGDLEGAEARLREVVELHPESHDGLAALAALQASRGEQAEAEATYRRALAAADKPGEARERLQYLMSISDTQLARGDAAAAQQSAARAMAESNDHPAALLQAARADFAAGDYDAVIAKTDRIITVAPGYEPARVLLAAASIAKGDNALAATQLESVLQTNPNHEGARKMLAQARMNLGSPDGALDALQPLLAANADDAQLLAMAGTASLRGGDTVGGIELMRRGLEASSSDPAIVLQAAANFLAAGEINQAIELLEQLPSAADVGQRELLLILALLKRGDRDAARAEAQSILDARPGDAAAHRLMGGFHLAVNEFEQARTQFEKALKIAPDDIGTLVNLSRVDVELGEPERAERRFTDLLKRKPGDLSALIALAQLAERNGNRKRALELLEQARASNPQAPTPAMSLARHYLASGDIEKAAERASQAVRAGPSLAGAHLVMGLVKLEQGRDAEALASLERAVELAPNDAAGHLYLGRARQKGGKLDAAYQAYARALELDPELYAARAAMIGVTYQRGDYKRALQLVDELERNLPDRVEPLVLRGDIEMARGDAEAALAAYERAAVKAPSRELAYKRAEILRRMGREGYWTVVEDWVVENPQDTVARAALAEALAASGNLDRARGEYERAHADAPSAATAIALAHIHSRQNRPDEAQQWLQKALEIEPKSLDARSMLVTHELRQGNHKRALSVARELQADYPQRAEPYRLEGDTLSAMDDLRGAIAAYERAQELEPTALVETRLFVARKRSGDNNAARGLENWSRNNPGEIAVAMTLAQHYTGSKRYGEAIEVYSRALAAQPDNVIVLNNLAWLYYQRGEPGDLQRGIETAGRAYALRADVGAVADTYGWLLLEDGQIREALAALREAVAAAPDNPEINYHYAVALHRNGDSDQARSLLDKLLQSDASFDSREQARGLRDEL